MILDMTTTHEVTPEVRIVNNLLADLRRLLASPYLTSYTFRCNVRAALKCYDEAFADLERSKRLFTTAKIISDVVSSLPLHVYQRQDRASDADFSTKAGASSFNIKSHADISEADAERIIATIFDEQEDRPLEQQVIDASYEAYLFAITRPGFPRSLEGLSFERWLSLKTLPIARWDTCLQKQP